MTREKESILSRLRTRFRFGRDREQVSQNCDEPSCLITRLKPESKDSSAEDGEDVECFICFGVASRVGMMRNCAHVFCHECLTAWRMGGRECTCPYCRKRSTVAVYADSVFTGADKERLFREHAPCYHPLDPILQGLYRMLNDDWKTLAYRLLTMDQQVHTYWLYIFERSNEVEAKHFGASHVSFSLNPTPEDVKMGKKKKSKNKFNRTMITQKIAGHKLQVHISGYDPILRKHDCVSGYDDAYADETVRAVNDIMAADSPSPLDFLRVLKEPTRRNFVMRSFKDHFCALCIWPEWENGMEKLPAIANAPETQGAGGPEWSGHGEHNLRFGKPPEPCQVTALLFDFMTFDE